MPVGMRPGRAWIGRVTILVMSVVLALVPYVFDGTVCARDYDWSWLQVKFAQINMMQSQLFSRTEDGLVQCNESREDIYPPMMGSYKYGEYFTDVWGYPLRVDDEIDLTRFGSLSLVDVNPVVVWSIGRNGIDEKTKGDDITIYEIPDKIYRHPQYKEAIGSFLSGFAILGLYIWASVCSNKRGVAMQVELLGLLSGVLLYTAAILWVSNVYLLRSSVESMVVYYFSIAVLAISSYRFGIAGLKRFSR